MSRQGLIGLSCLKTEVCIAQHAVGNNLNSLLLRITYIGHYLVNRLQVAFSNSLESTVPQYKHAWSPKDDLILHAVFFDVFNDVFIFGAGLDPESRNIEVLCLLKHGECNLLGVVSLGTSLRAIDPCLGRCDDADRSRSRVGKFTQ